MVQQVQGPFDPHLLTRVWGRQPLLIRKAFEVDTLLRNASSSSSSSSSQFGCWPSSQDLWNLVTPKNTGSDDDDDDYYNEEEEDDDEEWSIAESTRWIRHEGNDQLDSYNMQVGPWMEHQNNKKSNNYWTMVLNDVDRQVPALANWLDDTFGFLPRWRRDDAQISLAPTPPTNTTKNGSSIGPHVDNYDVFLIQMTGCKHWRIGTRTISTQQEYDALIPHLSVRILNVVESPKEEENDHQKETVATNPIPGVPPLPVTWVDWYLEPGDALYLPPRVVHWGMAHSGPFGWDTDNIHNDTTYCMTLSVGCRAPSASELLVQVAEHVATSVSATATARLQDFHRLQPQQQHRHQQQQRISSLQAEETAAASVSSNPTDTNTTDNNDRTTTLLPGGSITHEDREQAKQLVRNAVEAVLEDPAVWDELLGTTVTEPIRFWEPSASQTFQGWRNDNDDDDSIEFAEPLSAEANEECWEDNNNNNNNDDDDEDSWERLAKPPTSRPSTSASALVDQMIRNNDKSTVLLRAPGISFATSQFKATSSGRPQSLDPHPHHHHDDSIQKDGIVDRLYGHGQVWEVRSLAMENRSVGATVACKVFDKMERGKAIQSSDLLHASAELETVLIDLVEHGFLIPSLSSSG